MNVRPALLLATALAAAVLTIAPLTPAVRAADADPGAGEWNQPFGNGGRTSMVNVKPVSADPVAAWERKFETVQSAPVTWGGVLYLAGDGELLALDPATGEERAKQKLLHTEPVELAVWHGTVLVQRSSDIRAFTFTGSSFKAGWRRTGKWRGGLGVHDGVAVASDEDGVQVIEIRNGKQSREAAPGRGVAALGTSAGSTVLYCARTERDEEKDQFLGRAYRVKIALDPSKGPQFDVIDRRWLPLKRAETTAGDETLRMPEPVANGASIVRWTDASSNSVRGVLLADDARSGGGTDCSISEQPALRGDTAFGFGSDGSLRTFKADGRNQRLVEKSDLRTDTRPGPASGSGSVLYFGNWAVNLETGKILWSLPDLEVVGQAIPIADGRLALVTKDQRVVSLADAGVAGAAGPSGGAATRPAEATSSLRDVDLPKDEDGVLLTDGRFVPGTFTQLLGKVTVKPKSGDPFEVPDTQVLFGQTGGQIEIRGDSYDLYDHWRTGIETRHVSALIEVFDGLVAAGCMLDASDVLQECRRFGLDGERDAAMSQQLAGKRNHPNADVRRKKWVAQRDESRKAVADEALRGADWCAQREHKMAATVLLSVLERVEPGRPEVTSRATTYVPENFPWREAKDAAEQWVRWAEEILPARAEFMAPGDSGWRNAKNKPWTEDGTIGLRTPNLLFFSRETDASIVGSCLRSGEGAVRTLRILLDIEDADPVRGDPDRLDVRLHTDRKSYLAEELPGGGKAIEWSAGFFSPAERVSRFFVSKGGHENEMGLGRDLYKTLTHELTHHFVECRWMPRFTRFDRGGITQGGYWVVEGFARFVEDQSEEVGRRGVRFDDPTVPSVDCTIQLLALDKLMPTGELVDLNYTQFHKLPQDRLADVTLRSTMGQAFIVDGIKRFYEQAGSLVYFMMNGRGEDGHKRLVDYLRARYSGNITQGSWKALGFDSAEELDTKFREYLESIAR